MFSTWKVQIIPELWPQRLPLEKEKNNKLTIQNWNNTGTNRWPRDMDGEQKSSTEGAGGE